MSQPFPDKLNIPGPNWQTISMANAVLPRGGAIAEVGIHAGDTALELAKVADARGGALHVFDFQDKVNAFMELAGQHDLRHVVVPHGNSYKWLDSYNWALGEMVETGVELDYVYLDGAHSWAIDALAFVLTDLMLRPGGVMDLDDYGWSFATSSTMNPQVFPAIAEMYTPAQIEQSAVVQIVDRLVRPSGRYYELVPNKVFVKVK